MAPTYRGIWIIVEFKCFRYLEHAMYMYFVSLRLCEDPFFKANSLALKTYFICTFNNIHIVCNIAVKFGSMFDNNHRFWYRCGRCVTFFVSEVYTDLENDSYYDSISCVRMPILKTCLRIFVTDKKKYWLQEPWRKHDYICALTAISTLLSSE